MRVTGSAVRVQSLLRRGGIENVKTGSVFRSSFLDDYGVKITDGPLRGWPRAVVIVDGDGKVKYTQLVPEIGQEPDYDAALAAAELFGLRPQTPNRVEADRQTWMVGDPLACQQHAGHEALAVVAVLADRERLAGGAEDDVLVGDHPAHAHGMDADRSGAPSQPPRAPGSTSRSVGSGAHPWSPRRPLRSAVVIAVPDGASILRSWWYSITSAVSK